MGGIFATALILAAEMFLSKLEYRMLDNAPEVNLYMEYSNKACLDNVLKLFRDLELKVLNMEITRSTETETHNACALFHPAAQQAVPGGAADPQDERHRGRGVGGGTVITPAPAGEKEERDDEGKPTTYW